MRNCLASGGRRWILRAGMMIGFVAPSLSCIDVSGPDLCDEGEARNLFCVTYSIIPRGTQDDPVVFLRGDSIDMTSLAGIDTVPASWSIVGDGIIAADGAGTTRSIASARTITVRGIANGHGTVNATYRSQTRSTWLVVVDSGSVTSIQLFVASAAPLPVGDSVLIGAMLRSQAHSFIIGRPTSWATSDSAVATFKLGIAPSPSGAVIIGNGFLRAHAPGTVTLTATFGSVQGQVAFTVIP